MVSLQSPMQVNENAVFAVPKVMLNPVVVVVAKVVEAALPGVTVHAGAF